MKLANALQDLLTLDPRALGGGKDSGEAPSDGSTDFAGVLSSIGPGVQAHHSSGVVDEAADEAVSLDLAPTASNLAPTASRGIEISGSRKKQIESQNGSAANGGTPTAPPSVGAVLQEITVKASVVRGDTPKAPTGKDTRPNRTLAGLDPAAATPSPQDLMSMLLNNSNLGNPPAAPGAKVPSRATDFRERTDAASPDIGATFSIANADKASEPTRDTSDPSTANEAAQTASSSDLMSMILSGLGVPPPRAFHDANRVPDTPHTANPPAPMADTTPVVSPAAQTIGEPAHTPMVSAVSIATHLASAATSKAANTTPNPPPSAEFKDQSQIGRSAAQPAQALPAPAVQSAVGAETAERAAVVPHIEPLYASAGTPTLRPVAARGGASPGATKTLRPATEPPPAGTDLSTPDIESDQPVETSPHDSAQAATGGLPVGRHGRGDGPAPRDHDVARPAEAIVLGTETPSASSPQLSRIVGAVADLADRNAAPVTAPAGAAMPARTLTLSLEQAGLGPLSVRMHLSGRTLDLQLTASDHETLALLRRDRETLASAIGDRDYQLHSLTIQDGAAASTPGGNHAGSGDTGGRAHADQQDASNQRGDRRNGYPDSRQPPRQDRRSDPSSSSARSSRSGSLFV